MTGNAPYERLIGTTLGSYRLEQIVEQGEASCVFVARNNGAGALFRLHILAVAPDLTAEDCIVFLGRFQQEANQVASLQHTGILPLVDYGTHSAAAYSQGISWPYLLCPGYPPPIARPPLPPLLPHPQHPRLNPQCTPITP